MYFVFLYCPGSSQQLEQSLPLRLHGQYLRKRGWKNPITLVAMNGIHKLSPSYRSELCELGYRIVDEQRVAEGALAEVPRIAASHPYRAYTMLRFEVARRLVEEGRIELPMIVLDGDLFLTAEPSAIAAEVADETFILQGCPAFTAIADKGWMEEYWSEMQRYDRDPEPLHVDALRARPDAIRRAAEQCNYPHYDVPFNHDQDLQEYLIATDRLRQAPAKAVLCGSDYYWVQNPLFPHEWAGMQDASVAAEFGWRGDDVAVGQRVMPFYHLQGDYHRLVVAWLELRRLGLGSSIKRAIPGHDKTRPSALGRSLGRLASLLAGGKKRWARRDLSAARVLGLAGHEPLLVEVLNDFR
jgi:hypothetical protein